MADLSLTLALSALSDVPFTEETNLAIGDTVILLTSPFHPY